MALMETLTPLSIIRASEKKKELFERQGVSKMLRDKKEPRACDRDEERVSDRKEGGWRDGVRNDKTKENISYNACLDLGKHRSKMLHLEN